MENNFKSLYENNYSALCNYAKAIVKDHQTAEDIVQTVFIKLWKNEKLNGVKNPEPYLLKCVKYKCIDYLRRPERKQEILTDKLPELGTAELQILKEEDIFPMLHFFADKLPTKMRQVFLLSRSHGKTYKEIASSMNISVKTVENQMGSALKKMKVLLQKHQYLPLVAIFFNNF